MDTTTLAVSTEAKPTPVKYSDLLAIVQEFGLPTEEKKSGWLKIMALKGASRMYVPVNKTGNVTQIDLSEFPVQFGVREPKKKNGRVNGHVEQRGLSVEDILSNFRLMCALLAGQSEA